MIASKRATSLASSIANDDDVHRARASRAEYISALGVGRQITTNGSAGMPLAVTVAQMQRLQSLAGNKLVASRLATQGAGSSSSETHQPVAQRRVAAAPPVGLVKKKPRYAFAADVRGAIGVDPQDEARCHVVPYEEITKVVIASVNGSIIFRSPHFHSLAGLVSTIYPGRSSSVVHGMGFDHLAQKYYQIADAARKKLETSMRAINLTRLRNPKVFGVLAIYANALIRSLNNSPDNLRIGDRSTNSSIQGGLDLTQDTSKPGFLPAGTDLVDADGNVHRTLRAPLTVIRVINRHEKVVINMLTLTYSGPGATLKAYSSGGDLQSSDTMDMTDETMSSASPTPIAIQWSANKFFLFDTT